MFGYSACRGSGLTPNSAAPALQTAPHLLAAWARRLNQLEGPAAGVLQNSARNAAPPRQPIRRVPNRGSARLWCTHQAARLGDRSRAADSGSTFGPASGPALGFSQIAIPESWPSLNSISRATVVGYSPCVPTEVCPRHECLSGGGCRNSRRPVFDIQCPTTNIQTAIHLAGRRQWWTGSSFLTEPNAFTLGALFRSIAFRPIGTRE